jgi:hypothetical protein
MTPLQAAKAHCANHLPDGSCLGIYYNDDLSVDGSRYRPCEKAMRVFRGNHRAYAHVARDSRSEVASG